MFSSARLYFSHLLFATIAAVALPASAAVKDVRTTHQAVVNTSVSHILSVIASSDVCDKGCRYYGPSVVKELRLAYRATPTHYFKWQFIANARDTKFFTRVTIKKGKSSTQVTLQTLTQAKDGPLIADLVKNTQLAHSPVFDEATTRFELTPQEKGTVVSVSMVTRVSGLIGMFTARVKKGMEDAMRALFVNFAR
jgi:hypothetical protein